MRIFVRLQNIWPVEALQKNLLTIETTLGLTPKGLKAIKSNGLESAKQSRLAQVLSSV